MKSTDGVSIRTSSSVWGLWRVPKRTSVGGLLDRIAREWLAKREADEEALQRRLHAEAEKWIGSIRSGDRYRSVQVRERVRAKLMAKHRRLQREAPGSRRGERL